MTNTSVAAPALDFVVLYVSDIDGTLDLFTEKLGLHYDPEQSGPEFRQLSGDGGIQFGLVIASENTPAPGTMELYFKTADLAGLRKAVIGKGVAASPIQNRPFGSIFTVQTSDKHLLTMLSN